ncbi:MAG TPA: di-heme oxidoredictase family protein [Kofleriaceae bacterium]|jgi:YVTN family beta-propeller protein
MKRLLACLLVAACGSSSPDTPDAAPPADTAPPLATYLAHSSSIAVSADGTQVYVVNADADSVSILDAASRSLVAEIPLAAGPPAVDGAGNFAPAVMPRALALSPSGAQLFVTGERAGAVFAIDLATRAVRSAPVGSEPIGVVVSADGATVYVACSQDATVVALSASDLSILAHAAVAPHPWALGWSPDGALEVSHLLAGTVTALDPADLSTRMTLTLPDTAPRGDRRLAHGQVRGVYDVAGRPGTAEVWFPHLLLGTDTSQPELDFESTAFPAVSLVTGGTYQRTLSTDAEDLVGTDGAFGDVVSGPHALAFTPDGAYALVVDTGSEDVLAIDAATGAEATLLRPLPGHMPEGIALSPDGATAYVDERNTSDVAVISLARDAGLALSVAATVPRLATDPMPADLRLGQHVFFSANSDESPITQNHWISCASCHLEGRSDAVTWRFLQGPRDTPTNAGGMTGTGFLFRDAARTAVQDYWRTIDLEQGGSFSPAANADLLDALAAYVNRAIPLPVPPTTDPTLVAAGDAIFHRADVGCATCHSGARFTDSGAGNPTLDLAGPIVLHDVGTCVASGPWPDAPSSDVAGNPRTACDLDTPSLSGVASTAPYLHDGSAPTLLDVLERTRGTMGDISSLSSSDEAALVEYLKSL